MDGWPSVSTPVTETLSNPSEKHPTITTETATAEEVATAEQMDKAVSVLSGEGRIVASKEVMSAGDRYLLSIKSGRRTHTIPELSQKDVSGIELGPIRGETRRMKSHKPETEISDPDTAFARVLDLGISMAGEVVCLGTYTDENEDGYFVFYGIHGRPLDLYLLAYYVRKDNGEITLYQPRLEKSE